MTIDFKSQRSKFLILSAILISLSLFFFKENIALFPSFIHAWTQSDRYALALGFLNNGLDFFHPQTYNLTTIDGITRVDFPIHEYIVAIIMKLSGIHEPVIFRIYILCCALTGLIFLFRLSQLFVESFLKNIIVVLFIFFSPVFIYYADGFLPSVPSLAGLYIGYFYFFRYKNEKSIKDFRLAIFFLTIAALARLPFFIFLFAVFCQQVLGFIKTRRTFKNEIYAFIFSFLVFGSYQLYNLWLGNKYGTQFLVSFLPASGIHQLKNWLHETYRHWRFEYFTGAHYLLIGVLLAVASVQLFIYKKALIRHKELLTQFSIAATGSVIYFFLMLQQFPEHDYYFIDAFFPVISLLLIYLIGFSFSNKLLDSALVVVLSFLIFQSFISGNNTFRKRFDTGYWDRTEITRINYLGSDRFLDSIGVKADAKVLVLDGYTTNVPLILMNRKGWTVNWTTKQNIEEGMLKPFDLVAIQNSFVVSDVLKNDPELVKRLQKFADNGLISFYHKKDNIIQTTEEFLGINADNTLFSLDLTDTITLESQSIFYNLFADSVSRFNGDMPFKVLVTGKIRHNNTAPQIISSVNSGTNISEYFSFDLRDYSNSTGDWQKMMFQFVIPAPRIPDGLLKIYFWNYRKDVFQLADMKLVIYR